jgi:hypothetical protein
VSYIENYVNVVPIIIGAWLGSYCSLKLWKAKKTLTR